MQTLSLNRLSQNQSSNFLETLIAISEALSKSLNNFAGMFIGFFSLITYLFIIQPLFFIFLFVLHAASFLQFQLTKSSFKKLSQDDLKARFDNLREYTSVITKLNEYLRFELKKFFFLYFPFYYLNKAVVKFKKKEIDVILSHIDIENINVPDLPDKELINYVPKSNYHVYESHS